MSTVEIVGGIILLIVCVGISILVTIQEAPKQGGLSALTGSSGGGDSFFSQNQGRTKDEMVRRITRILGIVFLLVTIIIYAVISRTVPIVPPVA